MPGDSLESGGSANVANAARISHPASRNDAGISTGAASGGFADSLRDDVVERPDVERAGDGGARESAGEERSLARVETSREERSRASEVSGGERSGGATARPATPLVLAGGMCLGRTGLLGGFLPAASSPSLGVHLSTLFATTSKVTAYSAATCAHACTKPSKVSTLGAALRDPAPFLHLAKITAAVVSEHLAPTSPHARTAASHCSGRMPYEAVGPANASKDARSANRWSLSICTSSGGLYAPAPRAAARRDVSAEAQRSNASNATAPAGADPRDSSTARVTSVSTVSGLWRLSAPTSESAWSTSSAFKWPSPPLPSAPLPSAYCAKMDRSAARLVASAPGGGPLADSAAARAAAAAARSDAPAPAASAESTGVLGAHWLTRCAT